MSRASLDELEGLPQKRVRPPFHTTLKDQASQVNWRLVIAVSFGFLMWYAGISYLEELFK